MRNHRRDDGTAQHRLATAVARELKGGVGRGLIARTSRALVPLVLLGLVACGTAPVQTSQWSDIDGDDGTELGRAGLRLASGAATTHADSSSVGARIAEIALRMRGVPYSFGGATPAGFDCSGLVYYVYRKAGLQVPRTARDQLEAATRISPEQAQPGDLLFFHSRDGWHVAIYLGRDKFIHAPWPGIPVTTASLRNEFYREKLKAVGRLAPS